MTLQAQVREWLDVWNGIQDRLYAPPVESLEWRAYQRLLTQTGLVGFCLLARLEDEGGDTTEVERCLVRVEQLRSGPSIAELVERW